jgi:hypothetical protein
LAQAEASNRAATLRNRALRFIWITSLIVQGPGPRGAQGANASSLATFRCRKSMSPYDSQRTSRPEPSASGVPGSTVKL